MPDMRFGMVTTFSPPRHVGGDAVHLPSLARALVRAGQRPEVVCFPAARGAACGHATEATPIEPRTRGRASLHGPPRVRVEDGRARADAPIEREAGRRPRHPAFPIGRRDGSSRDAASTRYAAQRRLRGRG